MNKDFLNFEQAYKSKKALGYEHINEIEYLNLLEEVAKHGESRQDRTGTGTRALFGESRTYNLLLGFPLLTTKLVSFNTIYKELLWMLSGSTNNDDLKKFGVSIWDEWAAKDGSLGPVYGHQWRKLKKGRKNIDQIKNLVEGLVEDPYGRRHIVNSWNPADLDDMALPPCHCFFQCYVSTEKDGNNKNYLDMQLYQRSADMFLGVPYNIASYAILMHILSSLAGLTPRHLKHVIGDVHIYDNHIEQVKTQLNRVPLKNPSIKYSVDSNGHTKISKMKLEDFKLNDECLDLFQIINYNHEDKIEAEVSV